MEDQENAENMPACKRMLERAAALIRMVCAQTRRPYIPTEGERLTSVIEEFEDERYPLMVALGWTKMVLERLPQNQAALKNLLEGSMREMVGFLVASDIAMHEAHRMLSECTGEPSQYPGPPPMAAIQEYQRSQLAETSDGEIESAEDAYRNTMRLEWYVEKKAAQWIVQSLTMLPLVSGRAAPPRFRESMVPTIKALLQRMAEIERTSDSKWSFRCS